MSLCLHSTLLYSVRVPDESRHDKSTQYFFRHSRRVVLLCTIYVSVYECLVSQLSQQRSVRWSSVPRFVTVKNLWLGPTVWRCSALGCPSFHPRPSGLTSNGSASQPLASFCVFVQLTPNGVDGSGVYGHVTLSRCLCCLRQRRLVLHHGLNMVYCFSNQCSSTSVSYDTKKSSACIRYIASKLFQMTLTIMERLSNLHLEPINDTARHAINLAARRVAWQATCPCVV